MTGRDMMERILRFDQDYAPMVVYQNGERREVATVVYEPEKGELWILLEGRNDDGRAIQV